MPANYKDNVFINCPFDADYKPIFDAIVFVIQDAGFIQRAKSCLILDKEPYRYQKFISDIAGQDIYSHNNKPDEAIGVVRNWLRTESKRVSIPGKAAIWKRYNQLQQELPYICQQFKVQVEELTLADFMHIVTKWLKENAS